MRGCSSIEISIIENDNDYDYRILVRCQSMADVTPHEICINGCFGLANRTALIESKYPVAKDRESYTEFKLRALDDVKVRVIVIP